MIQAIKAAAPLTLDVAIIAPHQLQALVLVEQIKVTLRAIERFDAAIATLAPTLPDFELFSELPGAGPTLAPRLLAAFGWLMGGAGEPPSSKPHGDSLSGLSLVRQRVSPS